MEHHQFRMRMPKEIHVILKRVACDKKTTMTKLFIEMFENWLEIYLWKHKHGALSLDNITSEAMQEYWKKTEFAKKKDLANNPRGG